MSSDAYNRGQGSEVNGVLRTKLSEVGVTLTWPIGLSLVLTIAVLGALPLIASRYVVYLCYLICINVALAQSWNLIGGYTGLVSLGHVAFFGIGAYTTFLLIRGVGAPILLAAAVGGVVSAGFAVAMSPTIFRFRGIYFTIGTLVLAEALRIWMINWGWTGGAQGLNVPSQSVPPLTTFYFIALALAAGTTLLLAVILRNRLGLALRAIRDNEDAAQNMGINTFRTKLAALSLSAFMAGLTGGIHAVKLSVIEPYSMFSANWTISTINVVIIGGIGTLLGPIVGSIAITFLSDLLANLYAVHLILTGLIFILVIRFLPAGLWGSLRNSAWMARLGKRQAPKANHDRVA
jgi:branched-chain amino acid transport system permease protein